MFLLGLAVDLTSSPSTKFTTNFLNSLLSKYCAKSHVSINDKATKDEHYMVRILKVPHTNDVSVQHLQTSLHRLALKGCGRRKRFPIFCNNTKKKRD